MNTLLLIRHAETDLAGRFCGHTNPPVNTRGVIQFEALLNTLAPYRVAAVHTSDLLRAHQTAQTIADKFEAPLHPSSSLREINFGSWEGLTWHEIEQQDPAYAKQWVDHYPLLSAPDGEAFSDFESRTLLHLDGIGSRNEDAVVVTHAGVIRTIMTQRCELSAQRAWELTRDYCGVFDFRRKEPVIPWQT